MSGRHAARRGHAGRRPAPPPAGGAPVRLERWQRRFVFAAFGLLAASGALWLVFHYFVRVATEWGEGPHPLESWWLRLHGLAAMLSLVALGSLLTTHVSRAWPFGRNRASGVTLATALALLAGSGYALYYFGGEQARPLISLTHWLIGVGAVVLVVAHVAIGRGRGEERSRRRQPASRPRPAAPQPADGGRDQPQAPGRIH
ncbi:MAG TPA: hypothetical protein VMU00_05755 [Steroidobacteraceae bacterium]|nr:hypothetical protein [Steroidobacteraceae bacterium]